MWAAVLKNTFASLISVDFALGLRQHVEQRHQTDIHPRSQSSKKTEKSGQTKRELYKKPTSGN